MLGVPSIYTSNSIQFTISHTPPIFHPIPSNLLANPAFLLDFHEEAIFPGTRLATRRDFLRPGRLDSAIRWSKEFSPEIVREKITGYRLYLYPSA
jgi:hypothetical protein